MYPIPSSRSLDLAEIADHWSREISPARAQGELLNDLGKAWWSGEFQSTNDITRLNVLRALFKTKRAEIPFWIDGEPAPQTTWQFPDGSADVLVLQVLPVPSGDPGSWVDEDCLPAYNAIARDWGAEAFDIIAPIVCGVTLSGSGFASWLNKLGYTPPTFWASSPGVKFELTPMPAQPLRKNGTSRPLKFVKQYITDTEAVGKRPTKTGLEEAAKSAGLIGGRDARRTEFNQQMGVNAPGRGRPTN